MQAGTSTNHWFLKLGALAALLCACATVAAPQAPAQGGFRDCGDIPSQYTLGIEAKEVGCEEAEQVIRIYTKRIIENLQHDWSLTVRGFHCDLGRKYYYGETHHCKAGSRVIRFRRGTR
jgi:hypothetical protein